MIVPRMNRVTKTFVQLVASLIKIAGDLKVRYSAIERRDYAKNACTTHIAQKTRFAIGIINVSKDAH